MPRKVAVMPTESTRPEAARLSVRVHEEMARAELDDNSDRIKSLRAELAAARQDAERMHPFAQWFAQIPLWRDTYSDGPDILDTSAPINELVKAEQVREARAAIQGATGAQ